MTRKMYHAAYAVGPVTMTLDEAEIATISGTPATPTIGDPDKAMYMIDTSKPGWEEYKSFFSTTAFRAGDLVAVAKEKKSELIEKLGERIASAKFISLYSDSGTQLRGNDLNRTVKKLVV